MQHAVEGERRRLQTSGGALRKMHPGDFEILDVAGIDLFEAAVMVGLVRAVMRRPVILGRLGIERSRVLGLRRRRRQKGTHRQRDRAAKISSAKSQQYTPCA